MDKTMSTSEWLGCGKKKKFVTEKAAERYIRHQTRKTGYIGVELKTYTCTYCGYLHLTKVKAGKL